MKERDAMTCFGSTGSKLLVSLSVILIICHWILNHLTLFLPGCESCVYHWAPAFFSLEQQNLVH